MDNYNFRFNGRRYFLSCEILYWFNRRERFGKIGFSYKIYEKVDVVIGGIGLEYGVWFYFW